MKNCTHALGPYATQCGKLFEFQCNKCKKQISFKTDSPRDIDEYYWGYLHDCWWDQEAIRERENWETE